MSENSYKPGELSGSGYTVDEILGDSSDVCVYTTKDNLLRWEYKANDGVPLEEHGAIILHFNSLMCQIEMLELDRKKRRPLYLLLGKALFSGLNSHAKYEPGSLFNKVEEEICKYQKPVVSDVEAFDLAIICALTDIELMSVLSVADWQRMPLSKDDPQSYYRSVWVTNMGKALNVIAAAPNHMGVTCAGVLATKLVWKFKPKMVAMTGIAAGVRSERQAFGDIIIPDQTYDYGSSPLWQASCRL